MSLLSRFALVLIRPSFIRLGVATLLGFVLLVTLEFSVRFGFIAWIPKQYLIRDPRDSVVHASYSAVRSRFLPADTTPIYVLGGSGMREATVTDAELTTMANEMLDGQNYEALVMPTVMRSLANDIAALDLIRHRPGILVYGISFSRFVIGKNRYNQQLRGGGVFGRNDTFIRYMRKHHRRDLDRKFDGWLTRHTYLLPVTRVIAEKMRTFFEPVSYHQHKYGIHHHSKTKTAQERQLKRWLKEDLKNYEPIYLDTNLDLVSLMIKTAQKAGHRVFVVEQPMDYEFLDGRLDKTFAFYRPKLKAVVEKQGGIYLDFERDLGIGHEAFHDSQHLWEQQAREKFSRGFLSEISAAEGRELRSQP